MGKTKSAFAANDYVIVYKSEVYGDWRWVRKAGNHKTLSVSSEGYRNCAHALGMAERCNAGASITVREEHP